MAQEPVFLSQETVQANDSGQTIHRKLLVQTLRAKDADNKVTRAISIVEELENRLVKAMKKGDSEAIAQLQKQLATKKATLATVSKDSFQKHNRLLRGEGNLNVRLRRDTIRANKARAHSDDLSVPPIVSAKKSNSFRLSSIVPRTVTPTPSLEEASDPEEEPHGFSPLVLQKRKSRTSGKRRRRRDDAMGASPVLAKKSRHDSSARRDRDFSSRRDRDTSSHRGQDSLSRHERTPSSRSGQDSRHSRDRDSSSRGGRDSSSRGERDSSIHRSRVSSSSLARAGRDSRHSRDSSYRRRQDSSRDRRHKASKGSRHDDSREYREKSLKNRLELYFSEVDNRVIEDYRKWEKRFYHKYAQFAVSYEKELELQQKLFTHYFFKSQVKLRLLK